jgi:hypothetical protein
VPKLTIVPTSPLCPAAALGIPNDRGWGCSLKELAIRRDLNDSLRAVPEQSGQALCGGRKVENSVASPASPPGRPVRLRRRIPHRVAELGRIHRGAWPIRAEERHGAGRQTIAQCLGFHITIFW